MRLVGLIIHHSLTKDGKAEDWAAIDRYHREVNGWRMVGYHVGVERINGKLTTLTGRPLTETGAHTVGKNDHAGLCIVGNFDQAPPDDDLLDYAATTAAAYLRLMGKTIKSMHPHNRFATKSCPGKLFPWEKFYKLVGEKLA